jgi:hypothetical protein
MPILQYETKVSSDGYITLPPRLEYRDRKVFVYVDENKIDMIDDDWPPDPARILPNGKTAIGDFLDYCKELNLPSLTDEEVDQVRFEALMEKYG